MKLKKILALILSAVMVFAMIAACGNGDEPADPGPADPGPADPGPADPQPPAGDNFSSAWADYLLLYDGIADDIDALTSWIHEGIMEEINSGLYAGDPAPGWWDGAYLDPFSSHEDIPSSTDDPITFTVFIAGPGEPPGRDNRVMAELTRITGVTLEYEFLVGDMDQKVGVMIASEDYHDYLAAGQARGQFLNAGAFANLDGLIQDYPHLWGHYAPFEQRVRGATLDDSIRILSIWGRRYSFDDEDWRYAANLDYNGPAFWIQKDVLAWDGYSYPTTLDEFFDLLARYYEAHPTIDGQPTLPFEIHSQDWRSFCLKNPPQHLIGGRNEGDVVVRMPGYQVELYQNTDYARRYYEKLNEVYHQGLIHPETFTRNYDQYIATISQGRVLAMFDQHWNFGQGEEALVAEGRIERTYVPLGLTFDSPEPYPYNNFAPPGPIGNNGGGISIKCRDIDRMLKFLDQLLSPAVQRLMYWGMKDIDYYVTEDGRYRRTPEQKALWDDRDWKIANVGDIFANEFPKLEGRLPCGNSVGAGAQPEERVENMQEYDKTFYPNYTRDGIPFSARGDFLPIMEFPGYTEIWSLLSTMDDMAPERATFDVITEFQNRYLPGIIMSARG